MRRLPLLAALLWLGACHDRDGSSTTDFAPFVSNLIQGQTRETAEPTEIAGQRFAFSEDGTAFDGLLPPDDGPVVEP